MQQSSLLQMRRLFPTCSRNVGYQIFFDSMDYFPNLNRLVKAESVTKISCQKLSGIHVVPRRKAMSVFEIISYRNIILCITSKQ